MRYLVLGKRGFALLAAGLCLVAAASFVAAGQIGRAIFVEGTGRVLPIYSVETEDKVVALGINCAWDNADVGEILAVLEQRGVKATFFLEGKWSEKYPESVRAIADAGHELGNHSYSHPDMVKLSREEIKSQLERCEAAVEAACGKRTRLFRAPSGSYNNAVVEVAQELGYSVIQWDCDTRDWKKLSVQQIVENGTRDMQNGSILLLHAGALNTADALPGLIQTILDRGYSIRPVGEIIRYGEYTLDHSGRQHGGQAGSAAG